MVDLATAAPPKEDALAALDRVAPSRQQLQYNDKRHQREAGVIELQITKHYEDRDKDRAQQRILVLAALAAVLIAFCAALFVGRADLAEKILLGVLPAGVGAGGFAIGKKSTLSPPKLTPASSDDA